MPRNSAVLDDAPVAGIQPEMLTKLKKEDMKQAIVERFRATSEAPAPMKATERKRSPYWRPADEEC